MERELEQKILTGLDAAFQKRLDELSLGLVEDVQRDCSAVLGVAVREAQAHMAEALSAAARRLRSEESVSGVAAALVETTAHYCGRSALLIHKGDRLLGFRAEGLSEVQNSSFQRLEIPLTEAAAIAHAIDTKDPVVTRGSTNELSAPLADLLELEADNRVHLFPIVLRESVLAVLYTDDVEAEHEPQTAAIELLTSLAEAWIEAVGARGKLPADNGQKTRRQPAQESPTSRKISSTADNS